MEKSEIFQQLKTLASEYGVDTDSISENSSLYDDLALDSLNSVDFLMECENRFNISMPLAVISHIETVADLLEAINHEVSKQA